MRVIPALLALVRRLAARHEIHVIALTQEPSPGDWTLLGARVHNIGVKRTRIRAVRTIHALHRVQPFDVIHSFWSGGCGQIAVFAARLLRVPSLIHIAGGELVALPEINYGGRLRWRGRVSEALVLRSTSHITAASAPIIEGLCAVGLQGERVPLGVDLKVWPSRQPVRRAVGSIPRLLHVASLNRVKDQATLLNALALLKRTVRSFRVDIVGEDTLHGSIHSLAAQLQLDSQVFFHGFLAQAQLRPLMEAADLLVMSSRHEAGPLAMLEAAVAGVPTVGTSVGHIAEYAPAGALAVPVGDARALADAIGRVIADEDLRLSIATIAHERAVSEDADYTARRFEALYEQVIR